MISGMRSVAQNLRVSVGWAMAKCISVEQENRWKRRALRPLLGSARRADLLARSLLFNRRMQERPMVRAAVVFTTLVGIFMLARPAFAHCDTTRGPVVNAAREALEANDANLVLHWVGPEDEAAVRTAFEHTIKVRALGPDAKELADRYFFETLVRIHRAGEGAPYTGLTDGEPEPIIAATDRAIERGSAEEIEQELVSTVKAGLAERFAAAQAAKNFRAGDVAGGRAFVAAYVLLTHWVEGVFTAATVDEHHAAAPHDGHAVPAVVHSPLDHGSGTTTTDDHSPTTRRALPWMVSGLLAIAVLVQGVFLLRQRRRSHATA